jgi:hypothetical protein
MIGRRVIWNEVKQQSHASVVNSLGNAFQGRIAAEVGMHGICANSKRRTADILVGQVGQQFLELMAPFAVL